MNTPTETPLAKLVAEMRASVNQPPIRPHWAEVKFVDLFRVLDACDSMREALEFSAGGCLVPPDGGAPDVQDHINNARAVLAKHFGETKL